MGFTRILIPIDGGPVSLHAARVGVELAQTLNAEMATPFVFAPPASHSNEIKMSAEQLGSVAEAVVRHASCPVLVVRGAE